MLAMLDSPDVTPRCDDLIPQDRWIWKIAPLLENVGRARHLVEEAAGTLLAAEAIYDLVLATSEIVTNSIKAAITNKIGQPIVLTLIQTGEWVTLTCVDGNGQTPEARRIPPVQYLKYHTKKPGTMRKRDWKRWQRRHSLGIGIQVADRLSRDNGGMGFVLVRDGAQVRATLTMRLGVRTAYAGVENLFAAEIAALVA